MKPLHEGCASHKKGNEMGHFWKASPAVRRMYAFGLLVAVALVGAFAFTTLKPASATSAVTMDTREVQRDLAGLDYLPLSGVDGVMGPQTKEAIIAFQSDNNLKQIDGVAGPETDNALSNKVKQVQKVAGTDQDGDYGPITLDAVKKFQSAHHLAVDGIAGSDTMKAMNIVRVVGGDTHSGNGRDKIVNAARNELRKGIHEIPDGSNCNPYGPCEPWCALFASWTWRQAGVDFHTAFSGDFYYYGQRHHTLHKGLSNPQPGDAILFGTGPQNGDTSVHVGIIVKVLPNGQVISIEGNYGNRVAQVGPYSPASRQAYAIVSPSF